MYDYNNRVNSLIESEYAYKHNLYGKGITVAILDTGIYPHTDFVDPRNRIIAFKDCVYRKSIPYDNNGHGSHIAGIVGSCGKNSRNEYIGVAPECNLVIVKVLDASGNGKVSTVIQGLNWIRQNYKRYNIRIVNISMGSFDSHDIGEDASLVRMVNALWDEGIIVCVAAGNRGPDKSSITTPGISRKVITVGASDDYETIKLDDKHVKNYSGRGPTRFGCIVKPEIVAPGSNILSCANDKNGYAIKSGTSMATPIVAGAIALLLEKEPWLTNKAVKLKLHDSAVDLNLPKNQQGWGMLNVRRLLS